MVSGGVIRDGEAVGSSPASDLLFLLIFELGERFF